MVDFVIILLGDKSVFGRMGMTYLYHYQSPLGGITLASDGFFLTGLWFDGQKYFADTVSGHVRTKQVPVFRQVARWLDIYFSGKEPSFMPPIKIQTTPFRKQVSEIMLAIPYGHTATYGEIAVQIERQNGGGRMSAQAVGGAVSHNCISLIIPCHRVVGANGKLTGYAGGIDRKIKLLQLEKVLI